MSHLKLFLASQTSYIIRY